MLLKTSTIDIRIVKEEHNLPVVFESFSLEKQRKLWFPTCILAYATSPAMHWTFSMTMILVLF